MERGYLPPCVGELLNKVRTQKARGPGDKGGSRTHGLIGAPPPAREGIGGTWRWPQRNYSPEYGWIWDGRRASYPA